MEKPISQNIWKPEKFPSAIVKAPKIELSEKDKIILNLEQKVEKIEAALNGKRRGEIWLNILYAVIGGVVGSVVTFIFS